MMNTNTKEEIRFKLAAITAGASIMVNTVMAHLPRDSNMGHHTTNTFEEKESKFKGSLARF